MNNLILIDTSYVTFYRFFAILKWLLISKPDEYKEHIANPDYNWIKDKIFLEKYEKIYFESLKKLVGKKIFSKSNVIFCMDCPKDTIWRTLDIKCNYKGDRIDLSKKNDFKPIFKYTYQTLLPKFIKDNKNIKKLKLDNLEADDIIGIIIKYYENTDPTKNIYLLSGDKDFLQLGRDHLYFINFKTKKPYQISKDEAKLLLHAKILLGDKSDCITSIFPSRFPLDKKKILINSIEEFNIWLKENQNFNQKYIDNSTLIDFNYIPEKYKIQIIVEYLKLFNK